MKCKFNLDIRGNIRRFKPLHSRIKKHRLYAIDVETEIIGKRHHFILGSIVGEQLSRSFYSKEDMISFFISNFSLLRGSYVFATNLAFDILELFKDTRYIKEFKILEKNSNFIAVFWKKGKNQITFLDTMNYARLSVESMGKIIKHHKLPKPLFLGHRWNNNIERLQLMEYNINDSVISYKFMKMLQEQFNALGAELKITIASTSLNLYRRKYMPKCFMQPNKDIMKLIFSAYYGGRTEAFKRGHFNHLNYYDINSLYPYVMKAYEFPDVNKFYHSKSIGIAHIESFEGVADVLIEAPLGMNIPYLPYRKLYKDKTIKLLFPIGAFRGSYTFFELRRALDIGYKLYKIYDAVVYKEKLPLFSSYVNKLYALRKEYIKKGDEREKLIKLCMNSLYGKFAQKPVGKKLIIHKSMLDEKLAKDAENIDEIGNFICIRYKADDATIPIFINPILAVYATAYARDILYQNIDADTVYCDTDSIFTTKHLPVSDELGGFKCVYADKEAWIIKPKMYRFCDEVKAKGLSKLSADDFSALISGKAKKHKMAKFAKFREALRRKKDFNEMMDVYKLVELDDDKRIWPSKFRKELLMDNEESYPICLTL